MSRSGRVTKEATSPRPPVRYPGEVEEAMPEGNLARWLATYLLQTILRIVAIRERDSAYANLPIYHVKGQPAKYVAPDVFFLRGVPFDPDLESYRLWETGIPPRVVFEIVSKRRGKKDRVTNRAIYAALGIEEYYWFDPRKARIEALRLDPATGSYERLAADARGRFESSNLGLAIGLEGRLLALYQDGVYVPPTEELLTQRERELAARQQELAVRQQELAARQQELAQERVRRMELEKRIRELEAELKKRS